MSASSPRRGRIPTFVKVLGIVAVLGIAAAGLGIWWFLRDDAPAAVNLETAVAQVQDTSADTIVDAAAQATTTTTGSATTGSATTALAATATATAGDISGTWTVDTTSGDFDYESATGTFAGFRIAENLAGIGSTTAVGRTGDVTGTVVVDGTTVTNATFDVDLTTITTNEARRNDKVQQALESGTYPTATFALTAPIDLGDDAAGGNPVSVTATGDLTIHGVTKSVEIPLQAQLVNGTIVIVGSTDITFADYGVSVPKSQIVLSVEDHGVLEMQLLLTKS